MISSPVRPSEQADPAHRTEWKTTGEMRETLAALLEEAASGVPQSKERKREIKEIMRATGAKLREVRRELNASVARAEAGESA